MSANLRPKYISFDCYGTLINFQMADLARELFADRIAPADMQQFTTDFARYRLDEVMGDWRPYDQLLCNSVERTCRRWGIEYRDNEGLKFYNAVPTWQPHVDVPDALARLATEYQLVIFSNAMDVQIPSSVEKLGAPFHRVYTAQQAQAYKPRLRAFESMTRCMPIHSVFAPGSPSLLRPRNPPSDAIIRIIWLSVGVFFGRGFFEST